MLTPVESASATPEPAASPTSTPIPVSFTPQLRASRLTGPAPLAVMFDATGTTASQAGVDTFRELNYAFSFGDPGSGNWAVSGLSKNTQTGGPLAAHVFETPGIYTVQMETGNNAGERVSTSVTVTVTHPDSHWASTQTICVSPSADYTGCPAGATQQTALPTVYEDRRVLLRRGESFGGIQIPLASDNLLVGAFGTGAKPSVPNVRIGFGRPRSADFTDEITIMDLNVTGEQDGIHQQGSGSRILLLRNDLIRNDPSANNNITFGGALAYYANVDPGRVVPTESFYWPREIFIVENQLVGSTENDSLPHLNMGCLGAQYAFMGNDASRADEHTIRTFALFKSVFAHNAIRGHFNDARHTLKFHSAGVGVYSDNFSSVGWASRYSVMANNLFGDPTSNGDWTITLSPQNVTSAEGLEDIIVENNQFARGPAIRRDLQMAGRRITVRGNRSINANTILTQVGPIIAYGAPPSDTYYGALPAEWKGPYFIQE